MRRLWYRWKLHWATMRARKAKAIWLATKETVRSKESTRRGVCSHVKTETAYCNALVDQRTYEKLVNPEQSIPRATAKEAS